MNRENLHKMIDVFMDSRVETPDCSNITPVDLKDLQVFADIIRAIKNRKWDKDCDDYSPVDVYLVDRNTTEAFPFIGIPKEQGFSRYDKLNSLCQWSMEMMDNTANRLFKGNE